jgi:crotonobetainyl-CoA:carnitine CoA-transferase CaiB-like acyl-CoA transferase
MGCGKARLSSREFILPNQHEDLGTAHIGSGGKYMSDALSRLRILEIGHGVSAAYACKLVADLGADVIKVEQAESGDQLRSMGTFPNDAPDLSVGGLFYYLNTNKRSVECDLEARSGLETVLRLAAEADIVIENLGAGVLERVGLGFGELKAVNPRIVLVRISDFGQDGPYANIPATDFTVQAASGWVSKHVTLGRNPVQVGGRVTDYACGVHAACAALTALKTAIDLGEPVSVDVSKQECLVTMLAQPALYYENLSLLGWGLPEDEVFPIPGVVRCRDGFVGINPLSAQQYSDCCHMMGIPEYIPRQLELRTPGPTLDQFHRDIEPWLKERTADEIVELGQAFRIPLAPVGNGQNLLEMAQLKARGFYMSDPEGHFMQPSFPYRLETTPASLRTCAPLLGEHNAEVAVTPWHGARLLMKPVVLLVKAENYYPFKNLRVLDLGIMWAGPYVGCYLGSMGADVIKVESIQRPDGMRYSHAHPQLGADWYERSGLYQGTNLNKRGVTLDLNQVEGKRIFQRLVETADVLIENFSPRVMDNFGFGRECLRELNPRLIVLRMPGFGLEGPWRNYVSFAISLEQAAGVAWLTGRSEDPPTNAGGFIDVVAGMHALVALQAALHHRELTGDGQLIEVAQFEVGACITAEQVIAYSMTGRVQGREGNRSEQMAPQGVYPCADSEWEAISVRSDAEWQKLVDVIGSPNWAVSERYSNLKGRQKHHDELDRLVASWTQTFNSGPVIDLLRGAGVPVARILRTPHMYAEPHLLARAFYQELPHARCGPRRYPRFPMRQSPGTKGVHRFGAPTLGQHNSEVLGELGLSSSQIDELAKKEIIGTIPKGLG